MNIEAIKTHKITIQDTDLLNVLDRYITHLPERSVLAVTSKIVALCEGRVVSKESISKPDLVKRESELFIPSEQSKYHITLTVTGGMLVATAGIDESNTVDGYVLWPEDPQRSANRIREHLRKRLGLSEFGVVITDSKTTPLRWGVTGASIAYSGFKPLRDLIGTPDIFGHVLKVTKVNIADGLAGAAVFVMGESSEQTPLALIENIPHIEFCDADPSEEELASLRISIEDDLYASLLTSAPWHKGDRVS